MGIDFSAYKVLVVDDVKTNVLLLKVMLEQEKLQVITAQNGAEALQQLSNETIDLILMDIMMPGISGYDLTKQLKSTQEYKDIPILFITALNSADDIVRGFQLGGNDFITKPFNKEELIMRIKHQISLIHAQRLILRQTEELRKVIEGRDKLYAVIAHDLRSPIAALKMILNVLTLAASEKKLDTEFSEMLGAGNEITEQVFCLLDNLLKWTKAQLGMLQPVFQEFDLNELIQGVLEVQEPTARLKGVKINFSHAKHIDAAIDTDMIKTVLRNIIFNAIKFSYPNGEINILLKEGENEAIVEVHDKGCGISEENKAKLLNNMTHFSTYGTNKEEGTGLGLLISHQFVELHQGELFFESEENKGSCFGFKLPLSRKAANF
jgi:two-component system sensor histidine kinase/response regulator